MATDTKTRLLDAAQRLVQTRGFEGFSFHDLSAEIGISTASIHYHFPTKRDLAVALVKRYRDFLHTAVEQVISSPAPLAAKLQQVTGLYESTYDAGRICVSGALAGGVESLPTEVKKELKALIDDCVASLLRLFKRAQRAGELRAGLDPESCARLWYCTLQGSLTVARASDKKIFTQSLRALAALTCP